MRFLCTDLGKGFRLKEFDHLTTSRSYAILSHRWGPQEVLLGELLSVCRNDGVSLAPIAPRPPPARRDGIIPEDSEDEDIAAAKPEEDADLISEEFEDANPMPDDPGDGVHFEELRRWCKIAPPDWNRFKKIVGSCWRAHKDGYKYIWIDTCCIDQKSSSELSESINSMYSLYAESTICYAWLQNVPYKTDPISRRSAFRTSEWFTRGWTLQELIAPRRVVFLNEAWGTIGEKAALAPTIQAITRIDYGVLCGFVGVENMSVAERMSWASNRKTTKVEDRAYSLLGIFGVNMTTIYGEGENAFRRLQYEIINQLSDHSIFAWRLRDADTSEVSGLLAPSPDAFSESAGIVAIPHSRFAKQWGYEGLLPDVQKTTTGVHLELPIGKLHGDQTTYVMVLACKKSDRWSNANSTVGVVLRPGPDGCYSKLALIGCIGVDQLVRSGTTFHVCKIDIRDETKLVKVVVPFESLSYIPKACQIEIKARTLNRLRNEHNFQLDEEQTTIQTFRLSRWRWLEDTLGHGQNAHQWVENPLMEGRDFVVSLSFKPVTKVSFDIVLRQFRLRWETPEGPLDLYIYIDGENPCGWHEIDTEELPRSYYDHAIIRPSRRWSKGWGNNGELIDITLTRTSIKPEMVSYELELEISGRQSNASYEDAPRQSKNQKSEIDEQDESSIRWVPTCLGIIPKDAYIQIDSEGSPWHIIRTYHKGTIKPAILWQGHLHACTFPSYKNTQEYNVWEYEILTGPPSLFHWVPVHGKFRPEALRGAVPTMAGLDADGQALYVVRALKDDKIAVDDVRDEEENGYSIDDTLGGSTEKEPGEWFGVVRVGRFPRFPDDDSTVRSARRYAVLACIK